MSKIRTYQTNIATNNSPPHIVFSINNSRHYHKIIPLINLLHHHTHPSLLSENPSLSLLFLANKSTSLFLTTPWVLRENIDKDIFTIFDSFREKLT